MTPEEIKGKMDEFGKAVKSLQDTNDSNKAKLDTLDAEQIKRAADSAVKALEEIQTANLKAAAAEKEQKERLAALEIAIAKGAGGVTTEAPAYKENIVRYLRKGVAVELDALTKAMTVFAEKAFIGGEKHQIETFVKDMVAGSNADGGYFLTADRNSKILTRIFESSPVRSVANVMTTGAGEVEFVIDDDEAGGGWVGETTARTENDETAQIGLVKIPVHELYSIPKVTQKMLDDAGLDLEAYVSNKGTARFIRLENSAFVVGASTMKPKGFLAYPAWSSAGVYQRHAVEQISSGSSGSFDADNLIELQNSMIEDYQANARWAMNRTTFTDVLKLKDNDDNYLVNLRLIAEGMDKILLGKPVVFMADMPVPASNSLSICYADFKEFYTVADRLGVRVLRDPYTSKPYVKYYMTKRVGGGVTNFEAGKILKLAA